LQVKSVSAGSFQLRRPMQVAFFVKARFDFDYASHLLAALRCFHQRFHKRRVIADAVGGHLDGDRLGIVGGSGDEMLHTVFEALVWMVDQDVTGTHCRKNVRTIFEDRRG
jgi:hypothetical protein